MLLAVGALFSGVLFAVRSGGQLIQARPAPTSATTATTATSSSGQSRPAHTTRLPPRPASLADVLTSALGATVSMLFTQEPRKASAQRRCPFYVLAVHLVRAHHLPAAASPTGGESHGVYAKLVVAGRAIGCSRIAAGDPRPTFDEHFQLPVEHPAQRVELVAMQRRCERDQTMQELCLGSAPIELADLLHNRPTELQLELRNGPRRADREPIIFELSVTLQPKTLKDREMFYLREPRPTQAAEAKKGKTQEWDSVVNIVLVEAQDLLPREQGSPPDPYVRFRVHNDKYKSKVVHKTTSPRWNEQFNLYTYAGLSKQLEISVHHRDMYREETLGRCTVNLHCLSKDETHQLQLRLDDEPDGATMLLLLTISGIRQEQFQSGQEEELPCLEPLPDYSLRKTFKDMSDVGLLTVIVHRAEDLLAADFNGKSDPFCVLELVNCRVQTHTEYKTLQPEWNRTFHFRLRDIHERLRVTLYDEDSDKKVEFLGNVAIPILSIKDECRWYQLKDRSLLKPIKGRLLLEFRLQYNLLRASWKTLNPKERKVLSDEHRFKRAVFVYNLSRVKQLFYELYWCGSYLHSCFEWESRLRSVCALVVFCLATYYFRPYMVPLLLLLIFLKNYVRLCFTGDAANDEQLERGLLEEDDDDDEKAGEKKTFKEKIQTLQDASAQFQHILGEIASYGERIYNTFNYCVPFLSYLAIVLLLLATVVLYLVPVRYLILAWGLNKFTKKLRDPTAISNNELLDFLSRVPNNNDRMMQRQILVSHHDSTRSRRRV